MRQRILSTLTLWTIVFLCMYFLGATGAIWLVAAMGVLTLHEYFAMLPRVGLAPFRRLGLVFAAAILLAPRYLEPYGIRAEWLLALSVIVFALRILKERNPENRMETLAWSAFGMIYIPFMLHFLVRILMLHTPHENTGIVLALWMIAVAKLCDTGALLTGMACGRHKMSLTISPKKTWEGAVGGLVTSALVGAGIAWGCRNYLPATFTPGLAALVALPIAGLAIVSDLIESVFKRRTDVKDSGQTIPGIGGIFDLSDSFMLTSPAAYVVFQLL